MFLEGCQEASNFHKEISHQYQFNLYHKARQEYYKNVHASRFTTSQGAAFFFEQFFTKICYITILSINWHGPSLRQGVKTGLSEKTRSQETVKQKPNPRMR